MTLVVPPGTGSQTWRRIHLEIITMQRAEASNSCARARGDQRGPEGARGRQRGPEERRGALHSDGSRRKLEKIFPGVWRRTVGYLLGRRMMECTEGGKSGPCSAFWETLRGTAVSVDDYEREQSRGREEPGLG